MMEKRIDKQFGNENSVRTGLNKGYTIGFTSGTDNHISSPGLGQLVVRKADGHMAWSSPIWIQA